VAVLIVQNGQLEMGSPRFDEKQFPRAPIFDAKN
jgi:hypothetical protein